MAKILQQKKDFEISESDHLFPKWGKLICLIMKIYILMQI